MLRRIFRIGLGATLAALVIAQFFQPARTNPVSDPTSSFEAVARPPAEVISTLKRACRDCHSNETVWPWYSKVVPVSWLVAQDVQEGRTHLNFSEWGRFGPEMARSRLREVCEQARGGEMPLWYYLPLHPAAKLSQTEVSTLCTASLAGGAD
jgi:hypothetical protein